MLNIGVDIDGTIKYTQRAAVQIFNKELKRNVNAEDVRTFHLDEPYGLDKREGRRLWRKLEPQIYSIGLPRENAASVLSRLSDEGHVVYFVTARPGMSHIRDVTESWLKKHDFPFYGDNLYMNAQDKAKVAKKLGIDVFFEDAPDHLDRLLAADILTVVVDAVYNRDYDPNVPRIRDWEEVPQLVAALEKRQK